MKTHELYERGKRASRERNATIPRPRQPRRRRRPREPRPPFSILFSYRENLIASSSVPGLALALGSGSVRVALVVSRDAHRKLIRKQWFVKKTEEIYGQSAMQIRKLYGAHARKTKETYVLNRARDEFYVLA